jgi:hypothetical protein
MKAGKTVPFNHSGTLPFCSGQDCPVLWYLSNTILLKQKIGFQSIFLPKFTQLEYNK